MFWNIGIIGRHGMEGEAFPKGRAPKVERSRELAKTSPAFDAWLHAYGKHLEEACQRANSRPTSPTNANGRSAALG
jgi:hypothetical protein